MSKNRVIVQPYQAEWPKRFEQEQACLNSAFQNLNIDFYHIGSTSIPGCDAKPIIDILGVTPDITQIDAYNPNLQQLGFEVMGEYGMKQRRFFRRRDTVSVNLHIFEDSDPEVERHLRFADYLRRHPQQIKEYAALKQQLAIQFPHDIDQYCAGKEAFIKNINTQAAWDTRQWIIKKPKGPRKTHWTLPEIVKALEVNLHLQLTYWAKYLPTMQLIFEPDVTVVKSDLQHQYYNNILSARFTPENAQSRVQHVLTHFEQNKTPINWWLTETDTPKNLGAILETSGLILDNELPGMYLELDQFQISTTPDELHLERVLSTPQLENFARVLSAAKHLPNPFEILYSKIPPILFQEGAAQELYIGYVQEEPVVIGMLMLHANVAGIYSVATIPKCRNKGYGTAMSSHLINRAKNADYQICTLQSSKLGEGIYRRLGFHTCTHYQKYIRRN